MIRYIVLPICVLLVLTACTDRKEVTYEPSGYLSEQEQEWVKREIIRYVAKAPRRVTGDVKFDTAYDEHYTRQLEGHELLAYYISPENEHFFLIARIAPSLEEKMVATGGRMRFDSNWKLIEYEEVFRTWKLPRPLLKERGLYLFGLLVKGEDLTPYYTARAGFNYIEFPDENVFFDKESRMWKSKQYGSVEEMVYESRDADSLSKKTGR